MEKELTEEQINRLCADLRAYEFLMNTKDVWGGNAEIMKQFILLEDGMKKIMEALTDEQRDRVLEEHKLQSAALKARKKMKRKGVKKTKKEKR